LVAQPEKFMNTQISSKFAALAVALMMNSLIIGAVAYLFNGSLHSHTAVATGSGQHPDVRRRRLSGHSAGVALDYCGIQAEH
jgi:hypothetical protein